MTMTNVPVQRMCQCACAKGKKRFCKVTFHLRVGFEAIDGSWDFISTVVLF